MFQSYSLSTVFDVVMNTFGYQTMIQTAFFQVASSPLDGDNDV